MPTAQAPIFPPPGNSAQSAQQWPLAQVNVIAAIAEAQAAAGFAASTEQSLQAAQQVALRLPMLHGYPQPRNNRSHAYERILIAASHSHNLGYARTTAAAWESADPKAAVEIARAWITAHQTDEAIAFIGTVTNLADRVKAQLSLAQTLLDRAGAPNM